MSKIRMNTELRTKILNRYGESAEKEITQESDAFNGAREKVNIMYPKAFNLARLVVQRSYPEEDVATCKSLKQKYGQPLDVVAKDKCFYFSYAKDELKKMKMKATEMYLNILILVFMVVYLIVIIVEVIQENNLLMLIREKN